MIQLTMDPQTTTIICQSNSIPNGPFTITQNTGTKTFNLISPLSDSCSTAQGLLIIVESPDAKDIMTSILCKHLLEIKMNKSLHCVMIVGTDKNTTKPVILNKSFSTLFDEYIQTLCTAGGIDEWFYSCGCISDDARLCLGYLSFFIEAGVAKQKMVWDEAGYQKIMDNDDIAKLSKSVIDVGDHEPGEFLKGTIIVNWTWLSMLLLS